jgi:hypothetical protein
VRAGGGPGAALAETTWMEPYPDRQLEASGSLASPEARYDQRESLELADASSIDGAQMFGRFGLPATIP